MLLRLNLQQACTGEAPTSIQLLSRLLALAEDHAQKEGPTCELIVAETDSLQL
jgi:hypothetical protein